MTSRLFSNVRAIPKNDRGKAYGAANTAMVDAYLRIGQLNVEKKQGGATRAEYGDQLIRHLASQLSESRPVANLENFSQLHLTFPDAGKSYALRGELSWARWQFVMRAKTRMPKPTVVCPLLLFEHLPAPSKKWEKNQPSFSCPFKNTEMNIVIYFSQPLKTGYVT